MADPTGEADKRTMRLGFDRRLMLEFLREYNIPGGSLAIAKEGRLVFAHGYGWAVVEEKKPVRPVTRFNLASCSKPLTAVAILKLVDQGKLRLDDKVFELLKDIKPPPGEPVERTIEAHERRRIRLVHGPLVRRSGR